MTTRKYSSRSQQTTLAYSVTSSDALIKVISASVLIPSITIDAGETFTIVVDPDTALEEIMDVTGVSGNNLDVVRAIDGSNAVAHSAGAVVRHMVIGRDLRDAVKVTDTETITNAMVATGITKDKISGNAITAADTGTVTNVMLAGSIAESKHQLTLLGSGTLSGSSLNQGFTAGYRRIFVFVQGWSSTGTSTLNIRLNSDSGSNYYSSGATAASTSLTVGQSLAAASVSYATFVIELADQTTIPKMIVCDGTGVVGGRYSGTSAISTITFFTSSGTFDAGTYAVYGQ